MDWDEELYNDWKSNALEELENSEYAEDCKTGKCEICENGSVYLGGMVWLPANTVTSWEDFKNN